MNLLIFILAGLVSAFQPNQQYPHASAHICAVNGAPVGSTLEIVNRSNGKWASCAVVGINASLQQKHVLSVSEGVRKDLHFSDSAYVDVYRVLGRIPPCSGVKPTAAECSRPPDACAMPNALNVCL